MQKITNEDFQIINMLEKYTRARLTDVISTDDTMVLVVKKGDLTRVVGKHGANVARLRRMFGKRIEVIEAAKDLKQLLANVFYPVQVKDFAVVNQAAGSGKRVVQVEVDRENKGLAIGRGGEKIKIARLLTKRYFNLDDLKIL
jgi:N utilization substance protein A